MTMINIIPTKVYVNITDIFGIAYKNDIQNEELDIKTLN